MTMRSRWPIVPIVIVACGVVMAAGVAGAAPQPTRVDLALASVDGHEILGRSIAGVTAALGKPSWRRRGVAVYRLGYGETANFSKMVIFRKRGHVFRAVSVVFERQPLYERRMSMNVLTMPPAAFVRAVRSAYGSEIRVVRPLRCRNHVCTVILGVGGSGTSVTFGRTNQRGSFLSLWKR